MDWAWAVDFGGTSVKLGLVDREGRLRAQSAFETRATPDVEAWVSRVERELRALSAAVDPAATPLGIGVGVPGFVDYGRGFIHDLTNVPGWAAVPLRDVLFHRLGIPAAVDNDANAMALAESRFGAGRGRRQVVFVTLGTGVGGGLYLDGRLYRGAHSMAGEIGHLSIDWQGAATPQGRGGLETYVGIAGLVRHAIGLLRAGRVSILTEWCEGRLEALTPKLLSEAAKEGDAVALECFNRMAAALGSALASLTYVLQPEVFVVGGGVAGAGETLFEPLRRELRERLSPHFASRVAVVPAALGADAGLVGAGALVWDLPELHKDGGES
jgi:glucokinase